MLAARVFHMRIAPLVKTSIPALRTTLTLRPQNCVRQELYKQFGNDSRDRVSHVARRQTLREKIMAPATDTAFNLGKGAVAGGAVLGLGALCFYGLGLSNQAGALEHSMYVFFSPPFRK